MTVFRVSPLFLGGWLDCPPASPTGRATRTASLLDVHGMTPRSADDRSDRDDLAPAGTGEDSPACMRAGLRPGLLSAPAGHHTASEPLSTSRSQGTEGRLRSPTETTRREARADIPRGSAPPYSHGIKEILPIKPGMSLAESEEKPLRWCLGICRSKSANLRDCGCTTQNITVTEPGAGRL